MRMLQDLPGKGKRGYKCTSSSSFYSSTRPRRQRAMSQPFIISRGSEGSECWRAAQGRPLPLAELRDTLLPKLISGEIRVPEAEEEVEAVV